MNLFRFLSAGLLGLGSLVLALPAQAVIIGSVTDNLNGTWTYDYTVDNTNGAFDVFAFDLSFLNAGFDEIGGDLADAILVGGLDGMALPNDDWEVEELISGEFTFTDLFGFGVEAGSSLDGFTFVSSFGPGTIDFFASGPLAGEELSGTVTGPVVPEPASLALLAFGVLAFLFVRRRLRS